jgi:hypothetical protein
MYECLVGYTPFYADDPVTTCKKILHWKQCLSVPEEVRRSVSKEVGGKGWRRGRGGRGGGEGRGS